MFRTSITEAVVLHSHRFGEFHKGVTLLTRDQGILRAVAHGAQKARSRLRGATESFVRATVYLYHDPVKDAYKITDMTVVSVYESLRADLQLYYTATLWAEVVLKSYGGGGSHPAVFRLLVDCLERLEREGGTRAPYASVQFLWRYLRLAGLRPDTGGCARCGKSLAPDMDAFLDAFGTAFVCAECAGQPGAALDPGARRLLETTETIALSQALRYGLEQRSLSGLREVLYRLLEGLLETRLNTLAYMRMPRVGGGHPSSGAGRVNAGTGRAGVST